MINFMLICLAFQILVIHIMTWGALVKVIAADSKYIKIYKWTLFIPSLPLILIFLFAIIFMFKTLKDEFKSI